MARIPVLMQVSSFPKFCFTNFFSYILNVSGWNKDINVPVEILPSISTGQSKKIKVMKNVGNIVRSNKTGKSNYTPISNEILQSKILSCDQKSILVHLLSLPPDWKIYKTTIWKEMNIGRDRFKKAWKGLVSLGYIKENKITSKNMIVGYSYIVYEVPDSVNPNTGQSENEENIIPETGTLEIGQSDNRSDRNSVDIQSNKEQSNNIQKNIEQKNIEKNNNTKHIDINTGINTGPDLLGEIENMKELYANSFNDIYYLGKDIQNFCKSGEYILSKVDVDKITNLSQIDRIGTRLEPNQIIQLQEIIDNYILAKNNSSKIRHQLDSLLENSSISTEG